MNILTLQSVRRSFSDRELLTDVTFSMQEGEKIGIIGVNGTGKSTLLRIIAGEESADSGEVITARGIVIRYLPQDPKFGEEERVLESVLKRCSGHLAAMDLEGKAKSMLTRLGLGDYEKKTRELSGGQRKRLALAIVLLSDADVLILDEPTNHLDGDMCDWLENILRNFRGSLIMVTHDRYFLDSVCNRILEIDQGRVFSYAANYEGFLKLKAEREESAAASERIRQTILRKELAWVQRGARARTTKQKGRLQRYEELKSQKGPAKTAAPLELGSIASRLGKTTIELDHLSKSFGDRVLFEDFSYIFLRNDRVGFVGSNGCGKTTLMKIIAGLEAPDSGTVTVGSTVRIGYYAQEIEFTDKKGNPADPSQRVIDYIEDIAPYVRTSDGLISASKMLERFLFTPQMQYSPVEKLSGGERRRLNLLKILMEEPNVLILDEPTNDLDIATMTVLEDFLDNFEGIVIAVSHDRYFLDRAIRRIFAFEDGRLVQYEGGYTDYKAKKEILEEQTVSDGGSSHGNRQESASPASSKNAWNRGKHKLKFTFQEEKEYATIEVDIGKLEQEESSLEEQMGQAGADYAKVTELSEKKEAFSKKLEQMMDRWAYLEEKAQKIADGAMEE